MLTGQSITRIMSQNNDEEPKETIIIKRCKMPEEFNTNISEEELQKIIDDLEQSSDEDLEYIGDDELDDSDVPEISDEEMMDDIEDEYI